MSRETTIDQFIAELGKELTKVEKNLANKESLARLKEIAKTYEGEDEVVTTEKIIEKLKNEPEEFKFFSGIKGLDDILKGFRLNQVVVISAATKSGKTSLCVDMTTKMAELHPLWFPFEESAEELVRKFIDRNETPPYFCTPSSIKGNTMLWIEKKIIESIAKYGTKVVFIDHLHFIVPFSEQRQDLRIGEAMRDLKSMAKKWNVTIFLIAHMKKTRVDAAPSLEDLRDSSFVAQEADTVLMLWREHKRGKKEIQITNNSVLSVQANRRTGTTGNVRLTFEAGHFVEKAWEDAEDEFENF
jgi:replicative DNA helicase